MENGHFRRDVTGVDQVIASHAAFIAKAHGTNIPAPVAFDAFGEFFHPHAKPLGSGEGVYG
jgi:uncharacterized caspase-like protein